MGSKIITGEKTAPQVISSYGYNFTVNPPTYSTYRHMAKHPTLSVGRALVAAPILASEWSVEADDDASDEWVKLIQDEILNKRYQFMEHVVNGRSDYGFAPIEKVWAIHDGMLGIEKYKPLIQELTELITNEDTGALMGIKQDQVYLDMVSSMVFSFNVHGTNWYGEALLENCREAWNNWMESNEGAKRYDKKVAGGHVIVHFPQGKSLYNGTEMDNQDIAQQILQTVQSSGSIAIPNQKQDNALGDNEDQWRIEFDSSLAGFQPQYIVRLEYFDKLMARGLLLPERALQEGSHGTLAEAKSHGEVALVIGELANQGVIRTVNEHGVDQVLVLNFGPGAKGKVRITSAPLSNTQREYLATLYQSFLSNPNGFMEEYDQIDTDTIKDVLGVPKSQEVANAGSVDESELDQINPKDPRAATTRRVYMEGQ